MFVVVKTSASQSVDVSLIPSMSHNEDLKIVFTTSHLVLSKKNVDGFAYGSLKRHSTEFLHLFTDRW